MEWRDFRQAWVRRTFSGTLGKAQAATAILAFCLAVLSIFWQPAGEMLSWLPAICFGAIFVGLLLYGFLRAPFSLFQDMEKERDVLSEDLTKANCLENLLVELAQLRREGVSLRNDLMKRDALNESDRAALMNWQNEVIGKIRQTSKSQAEAFGTLDLIMIGPTLPEYIRRHDMLVHHSERLQRLKDFIDRYDAMLMSARGLGKLRNEN